MFLGREIIGYRPNFTLLFPITEVPHAVIRIHFFNPQGPMIRLKR